MGAAKRRNQAWPHAVQLLLKSSNTAAHANLLVVVFHFQMVTSGLCRLGWFYWSYWTWHLGWEYAHFLAPCLHPKPRNFSSAPLTCMVLQPQLPRRSNERSMCLPRQGPGALECGPEQPLGNEWDSVLEKWWWVVSQWSSWVTSWVFMWRKISFYPLFHVKKASQRYDLRATEATFSSWLPLLLAVCEANGDVPTVCQCVGRAARSFASIPVLSSHQQCVI